jgi:hypothetical protein
MGNDRSDLEFHPSRPFAESTSSLAELSHAQRHEGRGEKITSVLTTLLLCLKVFLLPSRGSLGLGADFALPHRIDFQALLDADWEKFENAQPIKLQGPEEMVFEARRKREVSKNR